jgi:hypothetical protein
MQEAIDGNDGPNWSDDTGLPEVRQHRPNEDRRGQMGKQQSCGCHALMVRHWLVAGRQSTRLDCKAEQVAR